MSESADRLGRPDAFDGWALELGALAFEGVAHPAGRIRVLLSMLNRPGPVAGATGPVRPRCGS